MNLITSASVSIWQSLLFFDWYLTFIILFGQILVTIWKDICWAFCQYFMLTQQTPLTRNQKKTSLECKKRNKMSSFQLTPSIFLKIFNSIHMNSHENLKQRFICYLPMLTSGETWTNHIILFSSGNVFPRPVLYYRFLWFSTSFGKQGNHMSELQLA